MFTKTETEKSGLDKVIDDLLANMHSAECDSEEYAKMADQLEKIYKLKEVDSKKRVSPDTLALIGGNLAGILIIVGYEHSHIVTSKALSFLNKLR